MEVKKTAGRTGIDKAVYINQIQTWLNGDFRLSDITATKLQKAVGGQYKKAVDYLEDFKQGYETKELADLPQPPEAFTNLLHAAGQDAWRVLWEEKNKAVADAIAAFDIERTALNVRADEYLSVIDQHEQEIDELKAQLSDSDKSINEVNQEKTTLNDALTNERIALAQTSERADQLDARLTEANGQLNVFIDKNAQLEREKNQSKQDIDTITEQRNVLTTKATNFEDRAAELQASLTNESDNTKVLTNKLNENAAANTELTTELATKTALYDQLLTQLTKEQAQAEKANEQSVKSLSDVNKRLDNLQHELVKIAGKAK